MDVDFPVDWFESKYERRQLVFRDAFNYQVTNKISADLRKS